MIRRTSIEALNDAIAVTLHTIETRGEMPSKRTYSDITQSIAESLVITAGYACQSGAAHALTESGREWLAEWRAMMGVGS